MSWSVTFALSVPAWGLDIPVRLLEGSGGNACDFTVGQIEAIVSNQCLLDNTRRIQNVLKRRNPCELRFTRAGRFDSTPERGAPR